MGRLRGLPWGQSQGLRDRGKGRGGKEVGLREIKEELRGQVQHRGSRVRRRRRREGGREGEREGGGWLSEEVGAGVGSREAVRGGGPRSKEEARRRSKDGEGSVQEEV
ncbi:hypothetical protein AMTR_s00003p00241190, partial [Amborella trichopoda]